MTDRPWTLIEHQDSAPVFGHGSDALDAAHNKQYYVVDLSATRLAVFLTSRDPANVLGIGLHFLLV